MKGSLLLLQSRIFGLRAVRRLVNLLEGDSSRAGQWCDLATAKQPRATRAFHFNLCGSISNISLLKNPLDAAAFLLPVREAQWGVKGKEKQAAKYREEKNTAVC